MTHEHWDALLHDQKLALIKEAVASHVLPMLARDGGGIEVLGLEDHTVAIAYKGACAFCPAAIGGTLSFIQHTLQEKVHPSLTVVPSF
jgi:NifU-like protein